MSADPRSAGRRLETWKQIAAYFGRDVRTAKRWEVQRGLPVHRLPGGGAGQVYAYAEELSDWLRQSRPDDRVDSPDPVEAPAEPAAIGPAAQPQPSHRRAFRRPSWRGGLLIAILVLMAAAAAAVAMRPGALRTHASLAGGAGLGAHKPDPEAQRLYLKGVYYWNARTPESLQQAVDLFTQSIVRDPQYAEPYAGLANCYNLLREYTLMPPEEAYPRAKAAAERAIALDDRLSSAHSALGFIDFFWSWDAAAARRQFDRAIELDPNSATAHHWYATFLLHYADMPKALEEIQKAQALQPESASILADQGVILLHGGHVQEGLALLNQLEAVQPQFLSPHTYLLEFYCGQRDWPRYLQEQSRVVALLHDAKRGAVVTAMTRAYASGGEKALLRTLVEQQRRRFDDGELTAFDMARVYGLAGDKPRALALLTTSIQRREGGAVGARIDFAFSHLQDDPDFQRVIRPIGLSRAAGDRQG